MNTKKQILDAVSAALLILLVTTAIYQTLRLWFKDSDQSVLSIIADKIWIGSQAGAQVSPEEAAAFFLPYRLIYNYGDKDFSMVYNGVRNQSSHLSDCEKAVSEVFNNGEFYSEYALEWNSLLKSPSVYLGYVKPVQTDLFLKYFAKVSEKKNGMGNALVSKCPQFDGLIIVPDKVGNDYIKLIFVNEDQGLCYEFRLNEKRNICTSIINLINERRNKQDQGYISLWQVEFTKFNDNYFLPALSGDGYQYPGIAAENPYSGKSGDLLLNQIEKKIDVLFSNPAAKWSSSINGVYTYNDDYIIVKYHPNNTVTYADYQGSASSTKLTLPESFAVAKEFLEKDKTVTNDIFLADYMINEDNECVFYFDYVINELPVYLGGEFAASIGYNHSLELVVENGRVVRYNKIAQVYITQQSSKYTATDLDYLDAINNYAADFEYGQLADIYMAYVADGGSISLSWVFK